MSSASRNYKISDIKRLFSLSGNQCAEPNCYSKMIADDGITVLGEICHISAASENGPRYDPSLDNNKRRSFENLILLCPSHHKMVDNPSNKEIYTKKMLGKWKSEHIQKFNAFPVSIAIAESAMNNIDFQQKFVDEFLTENLDHFKKGQNFDKFLYGGVFVFAVGVFLYLVLDYQQHKEPLNPINIFRIIPILPGNFCVNSWKLARKKLREATQIENKYNKWISRSPNKELTKRQHSVLSKEFNNLRKIK